MFKIYRYVEEDIFDKNEPPKPSDEEELDFEGDEDFDIDDESEELEPQKEEDPDFQGVIRTVPGACLVYKRKTENNTYEELWIYNAGGRDLNKEIKIRNSILAGTDIDPKTQRSPEGDQACETVTLGNIQYLKIVGLMN